MHHGCSVLLVQVDQHLGFDGRREAIPIAVERLTERRVVVDLAVDRGQDGAVLVGQGLLPALEVDARALGAQAHAREKIRIRAFTARIACRHRGVHRGYVSALRIVGAAANPTHRQVPAVGDTVLHPRERRSSGRSCARLLKVKSQHVGVGVGPTFVGSGVAAQAGVSFRTSSRSGVGPRWTGSREAAPSRRRDR
jgi:hypothetical protein